MAYIRAAIRKKKTSRYVKAREANRVAIRRRRAMRSAMVVSRNLRPAYLSIRRKTAGGASLTFSSAATENFYRYWTVSLTNGCQTFSPTPTVTNQLSDLSSFQSLFEQYRLNAYKIELHPRYLNFSADQNTATTTVRNVPMVYICKDPTSATTYTGTWNQTFLNGLLENGGKCYRGDKKITIFMKPKVSEQYGGGANRYVKPQWTDLGTTAGNSMPHRGFHMFVYSNTFDNASFPVYDVFVTYYLQFRNPR